MRKVYLSSGHSVKIGRDCGAAGNGFIEGVEAAKFRDLLFKELKNLNVEVFKDGDDTILAETIKFFKNLTSSKDLVIDIHFNAGTPKATGTEVLIPLDYTKLEKDLASQVVNVISETLRIKSRGVKTEADSHHGRLGFFRLTGENILLELCFISNKKDMELYKEYEVILAKKIATIIYNYTTDKSIKKEYTVVKGDTLLKIAQKLTTTVSKLQTDNSLTATTIFIGQKLKL